MLRGCRIARFLAPLRKGERGQALIFFVGGITLIMGMAALAVDVGLWYTDRAVAQKDAAAAASAAVNDYDPDTGDTAGATLEAQDWAGRNGVAPADVTVTAGDCLNTSNAAVEVQVQRQSSLLFGGFFPSVNAPETAGASSACVASVGRMNGLRPIAFVPGYDTNCMSGGVVNFGVECELYLRRPGGGPLGGTGWPRIIDLDNSGPGCSEINSGFGDLDNRMRDGSNDFCSYLGTVYREGNSTTIGSFETRLDQIQNGLDGDNGGLLEDNDCDGPDPGSVDDFDEVFSSPDGGAPVATELVVVSCAAVDRLVHLPVVNTMPAGGSVGGRTIQGFLPFFITGCVVYHQSGPNPSDECDDDADNPPGPAPLEAFSVTGIPVKLQEPLENGVGVKGYDQFGTRRTFLYDE